MDQNQNQITQNLNTQTKKPSRLTDFLIGLIVSTGIVIFCVVLTQSIMLAFFPVFLQQLSNNNSSLFLLLYSLPLTLYLIGLIYFSIKKRWFVVLGISISPISFALYMLQGMLMAF